MWSAFPCEKACCFWASSRRSGFVGLALSTRVIAEAPATQRLLFLAGGVFTITLAVYIRD